MARRQIVQIKSQGVQPVYPGQVVYPAQPAEVQPAFAYIPFLAGAMLTVLALSWTVSTIRKTIRDEPIERPPF